MGGSRPARSSTFAVLLLAIAFYAAPAFAQGANDLKEGEQALDQMIDVRTKGNKESMGAQEKIDKLSDETDELLAQYRTALKQIDSIRVYNAQMRDLIESQNTELASLTDQVGRVQEVGRSVTPLMLRMIDSVDAFVELDIPFLLKERRKRVADLRRMMSRADVSTAEKFRQIMEAYQVENEYGRTIEAYRDTIDLDGKETTVDFLRFGRIALVYESLDGTQVGVWDTGQRKWKKLDSSYRSAIRQGLKIARKQSAPDLIRLPLPAAHEAREAGGEG